MKKSRFAVILLAFMLGFAAKPAHLQAQAANNNAAPSQSAASNGDAVKTAPEPEDPDEDEVYKQSGNVKALGHMLNMETAGASKLFELLNFVVLAGLLGWAMLRALPKIFRGRAESIQKQIVDARTATDQANARLAEVEQKLSRLDSEIAALQAGAEHDMADEQARIHASLEAEKQRIVAASEQEIAAATAVAQRHIRQFAAGLAIDQAAQKISVNAHTEQLLVEEFAAGLTGGSRHRGGKN